MQERLNHRLTPKIKIIDEDKFNIILIIFGRKSNKEKSKLMGVRMTPPQFPTLIPC